MDSAVIVVQVMFSLVAMKALIGFHFPWERCECCGTNISDDTRGV